jgi:hypothetical protein
MKMAEGQFIEDFGVNYNDPEDILLEEIVVTAPEAAPAAPPATTTAPQPQKRTPAMPSGIPSYESEIKDAMARAERRAKQDKWMALAQVGLGLMSSKQPTIAGAFGEAGLAGLESYRGARDAYEQERLGFAKELSGIESARASQRAAAAKASSGPSLSDIDSYIKSLSTEVDGFDAEGMPIKTTVATNSADAALLAQLEAQRAAMIRNKVAPQM